MATTSEILILLAIKKEIDTVAITERNESIVLVKNSTVSGETNLIWKYDVKMEINARKALNIIKGRTAIKASCSVIINAAIFLLSKNFKIFPL
jgi:hypothetical protein